MKAIAFPISLLLALLAAAPLGAQKYEQGTLTITKPWARPTSAGLTVSALYFTITNNGTTADRLVGYSSSVAGRTELHETRMDGGMARMRPVESLAIPGRGSVKAAPGGLHMMLMDLKQPLEVGQRIPVTLKFERAGSIRIEAVIEDGKKAAR